MGPGWREKVSRTLLLSFTFRLSETIRWRSGHSNLILHIFEEGIRKNLPRLVLYEKSSIDLDRTCKIFRLLQSRSKGVEWNIGNFIPWLERQREGWRMAAAVNPVYPRFPIQ